MNTTEDNTQQYRISKLFSSKTTMLPDHESLRKTAEMNISKYSRKLDFEYSNISKLRAHCDKCFPLNDEVIPLRGRYVDLLEFSNFNGIPYPVIEDSKKPSRWFSDIRYCWNVPLPHNYPSVTEEVLNSSRVRNVVEKTVKANSGFNFESLSRKTKRFYYEIRANLSKFICKLCAYVLFKIFRRLISKLLVCPEEMHLLRKTESTGIPIVYLPLHRSHLDYLLITWCNWHFGLKLPHIASGDNLNLSGLGWLLRATGAFFIRRRVNPDDEGGKDVLYRTVLHSYIEQLLKKDLPIEFFLEGTRSRYGKVLTPKNGLISNVVETVNEGTIKDCYLVPVSYTYDRVVEGIFLNELMGIPKVRESVLGVFKGVFNGFKSKQCGVVRMHYGRPVRLKTYLSAMTKGTSRYERPVTLTRIPNSFSYRELVPWNGTHTETVNARSIIRAIGFHVVYAAQMMASISPVSVVSCLLLTKYRKGGDRLSLALDCQWLCEQIISEGGDVVGYKPNETHGDAVLQYSLDKLKECLEFCKDDCYVQPLLSHKSVITLAYNKNSMISRFSIKSAIALAIISRSDKNELNIEEIVQDTLAICDWMQFEFIFCRPCDSLCDLIHNIINSSDWCHPVHGLLELHFDMGEKNIGSGDHHAGSLIKIRDKKSYEILSFFANLIRPFTQSLYIVAQYISSDQCPAEQTAENKLIRDLCQQALSNNIDMPFDPLLESINSDSFKNSLQILREKGCFPHCGPAKVYRIKSSQTYNVLYFLDMILKVPTCAPQ